MASRLEEVKAGVDAVIDHLGAVDSVLALEVGVVSRFNVIQDGLPAVQKISEHQGHLPKDLTSRRC
jgi:hypothetical protein